MEDLKKTRKNIKGAITRMYNHCRREDVTLEDILARCDLIDKKFEEFEKVQTEIESFVSSSEDEKIEEAIREGVEQKYFYVKSLGIRSNNALDNTVVQNTEVNNQESNIQIANALDTLSRSQTALQGVLERMHNSTPISNVESVQANQTIQQITLPRINLPTFDGTYTQWLHFRDLFSALIHERTNISNIEKFEYLLSHVRGEALSLIKHLTRSNENYIVAWQLVQDKFDKSEHLIKGYLQLLFDQPALKTTSVEEFKSFVNKTNEC